jgi:endoglucanase
MSIPNLVGGMFNTPYFFTYLISKRATDVQTGAGLRSVLDAASAAVLSSVETTAYPHGPAPNVAWGSLTSQGKYAEPLIYLNRLVPSDQHVDAVSRLADYALGNNPLGRSFITGMGALPPTDPLHLDSWKSLRAGTDAVPGITIYGPSSGPSSRTPSVHAWSSHHPGFLSLANQRRFVDAWYVIDQNEFSSWETMGPNAVMHAFLDLYQVAFATGSPKSSCSNGGDSDSTDNSSKHAVLCTERRRGRRSLV